MKDKTLRMIVRDENSKSNKALKKDLNLMFMTRKDCLSVHQGRNTPKEVNGDGDLEKQKIRLTKQKVIFWTKITGLISVMIVLGGAVTVWVSS